MERSARDALVFWLKSRALIARRRLRDGPRRAYVRADLPEGAVPLALDKSPLFTVADPREQLLELGKVQNLRVAAVALDGMALGPGELFSYWRATGRATAAKGYAVGRELRGGCMIPTVGGGICQLTNALSRVAHRAGLEIVERHPHTAPPPDLVVDEATDATVFWNYLDFRFRADRALRVGARLTATTLMVRLDALP